MSNSVLTPWIGSERALATLERALARSSADQLELFMTARIAHHTRFAVDRIHQAQTIAEVQVMARASVGSASARVAVSDLHAVERAVESATALARASAGNPPAHTPPVPAGAQDLTDGLSLWSERTASWDDDARSNDAKLLMDTAATAGCEANGNLTAAVTELAVLTSAGARAHTAATEAGFTLTLSHGARSSYLGDLSRHVDRLDLHADTALALAALHDGQDPIPFPDGVTDVVFGGLATGELIGFIPEFGFTGASLQAGVSPVVRTPAAQLAAPTVTVADDALLDVGLPFPYDLEGSAKRRVELLRDGRVGGVISDLQSAVATSGHSTGHAHIAREMPPEAEAANLVMSPGELSEDELIAGVEHGVYVQRLWYNRLLDAESGTILGTARDGCFLIEHGHRTVPLLGGRFTDSVLGALKRTDGIGRRLVSQPIMNVWNGCLSAPAIRVRGFRFGARPTGEVAQ